jgi:hypothetical protein
MGAPVITTDAVGLQVGQCYQLARTELARDFDHLEPVRGAGWTAIDSNDAQVAIRSRKERKAKKPRHRGECGGANYGISPDQDAEARVQLLAHSAYSWKAGLPIVGDPPVPASRRTGDPLAHSWKSGPPVRLKLLTTHAQRPPTAHALFKGQPTRRMLSDFPVLVVSEGEMFSWRFLCLAKWVLQ